MNKAVRVFIPVLFLCLQAIPVVCQVIPLSDARQLPLGTEVEVKGIVTNGPELGEIRYIQDAQAGLAVYPGNGSVSGFGSVKRGDEIIVRGVLSEFQNLLEISPVLSFTVLSNDNPLPTPVPITLDDIDEPLEGRLVQLNGVLFADGGEIFEGGRTYNIYDATTTRRVYIQNNHPLVGTNVPQGAQDLTGIVSQFLEYQLLLRDESDFQTASDLFISSEVEVTGQYSDGFQLTWQSSKPAQGYLAYGESYQLTDTLFLGTDFNISHQVEVSGLEDATFYYVQAIIEEDGAYSFSPKQYISTSSLSSGAIEVYFTQAVDESFSDGRIPDGQSGADVQSAIIQRIDQARDRIDFCAYNISREPIVDALARAVLRGVEVRYIYNIGTSNSALPSNPIFPTFGQNESALMHNKFIVIDPHLINDAIVITGSMNFTDNNVFVDFNNVIFIQDQALAKAYELEFEEMWGSETNTPNDLLARSGGAKYDNTPHIFTVDGKRMELYFSPSDRTTRQIEEQLRTADQSLEFALLSFTRNDLGQAVLDAHQRGVSVRGIIDNSSDQGSEYGKLLNAGVPMDNHAPSTQIHHKYALIDAGFPLSEPVLITGSHNWSTSAEFDNDENTLFIFDEEIINLYRQEFEARWGSNTDIEEAPRGNASVSLYPQPAKDHLYVSWHSMEHEQAFVKIVDANGRVMVQQSITKGKGEHIERIELAGWPSGVYALHVAEPMTHQLHFTRIFIKQ